MKVQSFHSNNKHLLPAWSFSSCWNSLICGPLVAADKAIPAGYVLARKNWFLCILSVTAHALRKPKKREFRSNVGESNPDKNLTVARRRKGPYNAAMTSKWRQLLSFATQFSVIPHRGAQVLYESTLSKTEKFYSSISPLSYRHSLVIRHVLVVAFGCSPAVECLTIYLTTCHLFIYMFLQAISELQC